MSGARSACGHLDDVSDAHQRIQEMQALYLAILQASADTQIRDGGLRLDDPHKDANGLPAVRVAANGSGVDPTDPLRRPLATAEGPHGEWILFPQGSAQR